MIVPEVTLQFLGGTTVLRGGVPLSGRAAQRRRIALLGILVTSPNGAASRDRLIGLLWPESDTTAARDLLNTAVYELRQALGDDALKSIGDDLSLNTALVQSDVGAFDSASASGDLARATSLYRGPFLDGLFLSGAPEFEHWLDSTRDRMRRLNRQVLRRLASGETSRKASAEILVRLADDDLTDGAVVREAVEALRDVGDLPAARRLAERHLSVTRDIGADAGVVALVDDLPSAAADDATIGRSGSRAPLALPPSARQLRPGIGVGTAAAATLVFALVGFRVYTESAGRHFSLGERDYLAGRYVAAAGHYRQAARRDSTSAMAWYRLSQSVIAADLPVGEAVTAEAHARALSGTLPEHERLLLRGYDAFRAATPNSALEIYRTLVALYPSDVEGWFQLGETLFHYNPRRGRSIHEAREPFDRVLQLEPRHWGARWHLAHLAAAAGDRVGFAARLDELLLEQPDAATALEIRALRALALRDTAAESRLLPQLAATDHLRLFQIAWRSATYLGDFDAADRVTQLLMRGPDIPALLGSGTRAYLAIARGRWRDAEAHLARTPPDATPGTIEPRLLAAFHPFAPRQRQLLDSLRAAISRLPTNDEGIRYRRLLLGYLAAARGDSAALDSLTNSEPGSALTNGLRGRLAMVQHRHSEAALLSVGFADSVAWLGWAATSLTRAASLERWIRAEALQAMGRDSAALGWYGTFSEHALPDVALVAPARLRRGEVLERLGRPGDAVTEYEGFVALWGNADAELQPRVADVRRRIARLKRSRASESR